MPDCVHELRSAAVLGLMLAAVSACGGGSASGPPSQNSVYSIGGTIAGLTAPGLVLTNGSDSVTPASNASTFTFPMAVASGAAYDVTVKSQPSGLTCSVAGGSGKIGSANVKNVTVSCPSPWIWVMGSNTTNAPGVYGTQGIAGSGNTPGARTGAASGIDGMGNLWLFGGADKNGSLYNDLWKFAPSMATWVWVSGDKTPNSIGIYGNRGIAAAGNVPGARAGAFLWIDSAGYIRLYGGSGYDSLGFSYNNSALDDFWAFNPSTGLWTWVSGSNVAGDPGAYGTMGVAAPGNMPPARDSAVTWLDAVGDLWQFGGSGPLPPPNYTDDQGVFNDLWTYSPATGLWTWVSGIQGAVADGSTVAVYGTQGVAAPGNVPTPRVSATGWTDQEGNLWVFGGQFTLQGFGTPFLNDLWKFTPATGLWAWMSGSNKPDSENVPPGVYGSEGTAAAGNIPGARRGASAWTDSSGTFWLFGGDGEGGNPDVCCGQSNDLWQFNPTTGLWAWVSGAAYSGELPSPTGVYGTQGAAAVGNVPGGRVFSTSWIDAAGQLWLFGGESYNTSNQQNYFNDLWKFTP